MASTAGSRRAVFGVAAKAAVSALAIWLVVSHVSLSGVRASLATSSFLELMLAFGACLLTMALGGLRWWLVLRGLGARANPTGITVIFSAAALLGQIMPSLAADGVRVWLAGRSGLGLPIAARSVVLERVFMVLAVLMLTLLTAPMLAARTGYDAPVWLSAALLGCGAAGLLALLVADHAPRGVARLPFWRLLADGAPATRALVASGWGAALAGVSLLANLNFALGALLLSRALGLQLTPWDLLAIMPVVTLATALPVSLGGWGVREGVLVFLLGGLGVPASGALSLSILFGGFGMIAGLPGLVVLLFGWSGMQRSWIGPPAFSVLPTGR